MNQVLEYFMIFCPSMAILEAEHRDSMFCFRTVSLLLYCNNVSVVNVVLLIAKRHGSLNGICTRIYYITHISTGLLAPSCLCIKNKNRVQS